MATRSPAHQIALRYRQTDSTTGVTRDTAKRFAERLGVNENQAIHRALHRREFTRLHSHHPAPGRLQASATTRSST